MHYNEAQINNTYTVLYLSVNGKYENLCFAFIQQNACMSAKLQYGRYKDYHCLFAQFVGMAFFFVHTIGRSIGKEHMNFPVHNEQIESSSLLQSRVMID